MQKIVRIYGFGCREMKSNFKKKNCRLLEPRFEACPESHTETKCTNNYENEFFFLLF